MGKRGGGTVPPPLLIRRIGRKINGPIRIWEAAQTEFVVKIRITRQNVDKSECRLDQNVDPSKCRPVKMSTCQNVDC